MNQKHDANLLQKVRAEISRIRFEALVKSEAFDNVLNAREKLAELTNEWTATACHPGSATRTARLGAIRQRMMLVESDLKEAEAFCRRVSPDRLQKLDDELDRQSNKQRLHREAELAQQARAEAEARLRSAAVAEARMAAMAKQKADEAALLARLQ